MAYLGAGGWLFRYGEAALLTAPFVSNPGLLRVLAGRLQADTAAVDRHLPPVEDVTAILVGHAHYDHLLDIPYIARRKAPLARVYGNPTVVNTLRGDPELEEGRLVEVWSQAGDHETPGEWIHAADGRIRFMALRSGHAPHLLGIHLYRGRREEPVEHLPRRARDWLEGRPLAYLIDFLDAEGGVAFRVHFQESAADAPLGFPPPLEDGNPVDLAILCVPGHREVRGYPEGILARLEPPLVLLGHWEDFFRSRDRSPRPVPYSDLDGFLDRMEAVLPPEAEWRLPEPGGVVRVRGGPPGR